MIEEEVLSYLNENIILDENSILGERGKLVCIFRNNLFGG